MTDPDIDPLDLIIQGVSHTVPWIMTILGLILITDFFYGGIL